jgi:hypothetical protein
MQSDLKPAVLVVGLLMALVTIVAGAPPPPTNYRLHNHTYNVQNEEQIFVCPTDSLYIVAVWRDFMHGYREVGIGRSTDGGNTWTNRLVYPGEECYFDWQTDPAMAVDNDGTIYICFMDMSVSVSTDCYLTILKSTDKGATWSDPLIVGSTLEPYFEDKEFIAVDRTSSPYEGNLYVAWTRVLPIPSSAYNYYRILFERSTDGSVTWDGAVELEGPIDVGDCSYSQMPRFIGFCFPFVGKDGTVFVAYSGSIFNSSECTYINTIKLAKSSDGGTTFTEPSVLLEIYGQYPNELDGGIAGNCAPICAVDLSDGPFGGNLYIAYASQNINNPDLDYNIEFIRSSDNGETWTEPIYINDDYAGPGAEFDQFHPWLICNEEGTLIAIFYDQRTDPENHYKFDLFAAYSFDGGESFTTNHQISEVSIDPDLAIGAEETKAGLIGEYIGLTAFKDHVNACWTDTRDGSQDVYGANWVIQLLEPRLQSPEDGGYTGGYPYFNWITSWKIDDDQYLLEVATDDQFANIVLSQTVTESELVSPIPFDDGIYYWRVKTMKISEAEESEYSPVRQFTATSYIPPVVELVGPIESEVVYNETNPTFEWNLPDVPPVPVYYNLELSTDPTFVDDEVTIRYSGVETTTYTIPDPIDGIIMFYWRVEAENPVDQSNGFCEAGQFELVICMCGDVNNDGAYDLLDIVLLIDNKFKGGDEPVAEISS